MSTSSYISRLLPTFQATSFNTGPAPTILTTFLLHNNIHGSAMSTTDIPQNLQYHTQKITLTNVQSNK